MNDQALVPAGRWAPAQKHVRPSALDIRTDAPRTPRFDRFTDSLADTPDEDAVVSAVADEWKAAQRSMLRIGRYLVRAKRTFACTFINDIISRLPFEYRTANMLMEVARGVQRRPPPRGGVAKQLSRGLPPHHAAVIRSSRGQAAELGAA